MFSIGIGYDVHRIRAEGPLYLGGIAITDEFGLEGHSDADVLLHAICDALLGAANLGDIGHHFPPSDPQWKNAPSSLFLTHVASLLQNHGWSILHIDSVVIAERPRIAPHIPAMKRQIASLLSLPESLISIKATTNEGLGFIGRGEGIAAFSVSLLIQQSTLSLFTKPSS